MLRKPFPFRLRALCASGALLLIPALLRAQQAPPHVPHDEVSTAPPTGQLQGLTDAIRQLQAQVQVLSAQVGALREEQQSSQQEVRELRRELSLARAQLAALPARPEVSGSYSYAHGEPDVGPPPAGNDAAATEQGATLEKRIEALEENQQLLEGKVGEQYQDKVESGSKYRLRLSGLLLANLFINRGRVDNLDYPEIATGPQFLGSNGAFAGSLRQSLFHLQAFGPDVAGARTSAEVSFDFAGGFPNAPNGTTLGLMRLRTGLVRLDWKDTSLIAGQDSLFFAPLSPSSLASVAVPPLSYAGNLWAWTPQVRVEHRFHATEKSTFTVQGGILDSLSADLPNTQYDRSASWGEQSGFPAVATRVAWSHPALGGEFILGLGGYYGRQDWGFDRKVDSWAGTVDLILPLGKYLDFTGAFYRGRAMGGYGGGIGQVVLFSGSFVSPATALHALDSLGGWAQLKYKPAPKFEVNGAFGQDNPYASQLAMFSGNASYFATLLARNQSWFVNFIHKPRSDVLLSLEYRRLLTTPAASAANPANQVSLSVGYLF
jgi:hypothetical protein